MQQADRRHVIRLRGPWEYTPIPVESLQPSHQMAAATIRLPADWSDLAECGSDRVRFVRAFGRPTGLDDGDRVDLVLTGRNPGADVFLNHECLGAVIKNSSEARFDVRHLLQPRNRLIIEMDLPAAGTTGPILGEVTLEITPASPPQP